MIGRDRDEVALAVDRGRLSTWLDQLLLVAAAVVALLAVLDAARVFALDRPTRDRVEAWPVWGVYTCLPLPLPDHPDADRQRCRWLTPRDLDEFNCQPIARAVRARFKGATVDCIADAERVARLGRGGPTP